MRGCANRRRIVAESPDFLPSFLPCLEVHEVLLRLGQPVTEEGVDEGAGVARGGVRSLEYRRELLAAHLALGTLLPELSKVSAQRSAKLRETVLQLHV